jgi:hypothetical protein
VKGGNPDIISNLHEYSREERSMVSFMITITVDRYRRLRRKEIDPLEQVFENLGLTYKVRDESPHLNLSSSKSTCITALGLNDTSPVYVISYISSDNILHIVDYKPSGQGWQSAMVFEIKDEMKAIMLKLALS